MPLDLATKRKYWFDSMKAISRTIISILGSFLLNILLLVLSAGNHEGNSTAFWRVIDFISKRSTLAARDDRFLAKVTRVIVFGSYLRAGVDRLSDVDIDIAVELAPKEGKRNEFRELNYRRVASSGTQGSSFSGILDREL